MGKRIRLRRVEEMVAGCPCRGWRDLGGWGVDFADRALRKGRKLSEEEIGRQERKHREKAMYRVRKLKIIQTDY